MTPNEVDNRIEKLETGQNELKTESKIHETCINNVEKNTKEFLKQMKEQLDKITQEVANIPDKVCKQIDEKTNLKIQNRVQEEVQKVRDEMQKKIDALEQKLVEKETATNKWIIGLCIGIIATLLTDIGSLFLILLKIKGVS